MIYQQLIYMQFGGNIFMTEKVVQRFFQVFLGCPGPLVLLPDCVFTSKCWHSVIHFFQMFFPSSVLCFVFLIFLIGTSMVAQWLRIRLPMQGTRVRALVQEDPTCRGAPKPVRHNYWACVLQLLKPVRLEAVLCNKRSHRNEKPTHQNKE